MSPHAKAQVVKQAARDAGFDLVGIARTTPVERSSHYRDWLAAGYAGSMAYLHRNVRLRERPEELLPGARSAICVALSYKRPAPAPELSERPQGRVAAYTRGADYHAVIRRMLADVEQRLRVELSEPFHSRTCVDTAPVLERELARQAGLGWIGKNSCLLHPQFGSFLLLGELLTTLELASDEPIEDRCARCTRCLQACPTQALVAPRRLDARRCISYLTIEHRGEISPELQSQAGDWVYGCDICQDVCPYNRKAPVGAQPEIMAEKTPASLDLLELLRLRSGEYRRLTEGSAMRRARRNMLRRNAAVALGNVPGGDEARVSAALAEAAEDEDPSVRDAARRSLLRRQTAAGRSEK